MCVQVKEWFQGLGCWYKWWGWPLKRYGSMGTWLSNSASLSNPLKPISVFGSEVSLLFICLFFQIYFSCEKPPFILFKKKFIFYFYLYFFFVWCTNIKLLFLQCLLSHGDLINIVTRYENSFFDRFVCYPPSFLLVYAVLFLFCCTLLNIVASTLKIALFLEPGSPTWGMLHKQ